MGRDKAEKITVGGLNTAVKINYRYYRPRAGTIGEPRGQVEVLWIFGLPVLPGFGRYHRLEPLPPGQGVGTTGRTGNNAERPRVEN